MKGNEDEYPKTKHLQGRVLFHRQPGYFLPRGEICTHTDIEKLFSAVCTHTATFHVSFFCNLSIEAIMYYTEMPLLMSE